MKVQIEVFENKHRLEKLMMLVCFLKEKNMESKGENRDNEKFGLTLFDLRRLTAQELILFDEEKISKALHNLETQRWIKVIGNFYMPNERAWKLYDESGIRDYFSKGMEK